MRRGGYTLIEVLVALIIVTAMMTIGVIVGRHWVLEQKEMAFFHRIETDWNHSAMHAEMQTDGQPYKMTWWSPGHPDSNHVTFTVGAASKEQMTARVPYPETIQVASSMSVTRQSKYFFTQPKKMLLQSDLGNTYELTFEMGWARLVIKKNGDVVD